MATTTFELFGPVLVSDLPPVGEPGPGLLTRLRAHLSQRRAERSFERALQNADAAQLSDLMALNRRR